MACAAQHKFKKFGYIVGTLVLALVSLNAAAGVGAPCRVDSSGGVIVERMNNSPQSSWVLDNTIDNQDGTWTYNWTVCNTSGAEMSDSIRDWELPWDPAAADKILSIDTPQHWTWSIETKNDINPDTGWEGTIQWQADGDPFSVLGFQNHDQVLHFYSACDARPQIDVLTTFATDIAEPEASCFDPEVVSDEGWIAPGGHLAGFSMVAEFGPTSAPYQASWVRLLVNTGDPDFPAGGVGGAFTDSFVAANLPGTPIPEPRTIALFALGLALMGHSRKKLLVKG